MDTGRNSHIEHVEDVTEEAELPKAAWQPEVLLNPWIVDGRGGKIPNGPCNMFWLILNGV